MTLQYLHENSMSNNFCENSVMMKISVMQQLYTLQEKDSSLEKNFLQTKNFLKKNNRQCIENLLQTTG